MLRLGQIIVIFMKFILYFPLTPNSTVQQKEEHKSKKTLHSPHFCNPAHREKSPTPVPDLAPDLAPAPKVETVTEDPGMSLQGSSGLHQGKIHIRFH